MGVRAVSASILQRHTTACQGWLPKGRRCPSACLMRLIGFANTALAPLDRLAWEESSWGLGLAEQMMNADQSSEAVR
jgi:hypothetical protein